MPWEKTKSGYRKKGGGGFVRNPKQYEKLRGKGMSKEQAARITNSDNVAKYANLTPDQIRHRKRMAARLGIASATIGLSTLGARGGQGVLRAIDKPGAKKAADAIARHTQTALIVGTGIGSAGALNSAAINRAEGRQRVKKPVVKAAGCGAECYHVANLRNAGHLIREAQSSGSAMKLRNAQQLHHHVVSSARDAGHSDHEIHQAMGQINKSASSTIGTHLGDAVKLTGESAADAGRSFGSGFSRRLGRPSRSSSAMPNMYKAGHLTRRYAVPAATLSTAYVAGSKTGKKKVFGKGVTMPVKSLTNTIGNMSQTTPAPAPASPVKGNLKPIGQAKAPKIPVQKDYMPGTITYHHEQAAMHSRKKASGNRQITGGALTATAGLALHQSAGSAYHFLNREGIETGGKTVEEGATRVFHGTRKAGKAVMAGGVTLAGVGVGRRIYHGHQQNKNVKAAQTARTQRKREYMGKAYGYDPEKKRQDRNTMQVGALAAGGAVAGGGAIHQGLALRHEVTANKSPKMIRTGSKKAGFTPKRNPAAGKLTSINVSRKGLHEGGRATALTAAAVGLGVGAHKLNQARKSPNYQSYR